MKKQRLLAVGLALGLGLSVLSKVPANASAAAEQSETKPQDETISRDETITSMDEEGNMNKVDSSAKLIENPAGPNKTRAGEPQVVNFRTKNNQITEFIEQETAKGGYTNGAYGADAVYLGSANGKYKFMLSGVVGWVKAEEVQVVNLSQAKAVSCYEVKDGKLLHHIVQDMTTPGYATSLNNGPAPSYLQPGTIYYSYDGHYFYTDYGVMVSDYRADQRTQSVNPETPYYNYFQYLPFRSATSYTGQEIDAMLNDTVKKDSKMKGTGESFAKAQNTYGVQALLMAGIAANESNWGSSSISQKKNNLFGLNAVDESPGTSASQYSSVAACIEDFANGWLSRGYLFPGDNRYNGGFLGNKASGLNVKYASDPYWGEKAANIVWRLDSMMGGKDAQKYTLAAKEIIPGKHLSVNVRKETSASSSLLYKTGKAANYTVLIRNKEAKNGFYEIQSDAVLNSDRSSVTKGNGKYNFDTMYCYMSADYLTIVSEGKDSQMQESGDSAPDTESNTPTQKTLDSLFIAAGPKKISYTEGEVFDGTGMQILARWSDGTESDVTSETAYEKTPFKSSDTGVVIRYTYEGQTKEILQPVSVKPKTSEEQGISLAITPETAEVRQGEAQQFGVEVKSNTGDVPDLVWEVQGSQSQSTAVDSSGKLTVGKDESADKIIVRFSLKEDKSISADAVVSILPKENQGEEEGSLEAGKPETGENQPEQGVGNQNQENQQTPGENQPEQGETNQNQENQQKPEENQPEQGDAAQDQENQQASSEKEPTKGSENQNQGSQSQETQGQETQGQEIQGQGNQNQEAQGQETKSQENRQASEQKAAEQGAAGKPSSEKKEADVLLEGSQVSEKAKKGKSVQTGDSTNYMLWIAAGGISLLTMGYAIRQRKYR